MSPLPLCPLGLLSTPANLVPDPSPTPPSEGVLSPQTWILSPVITPVSVRPVISSRVPTREGPVLSLLHLTSDLTHRPSLHWRGPGVLPVCTRGVQWVTGTRRYCDGPGRTARVGGRGWAEGSRGDGSWGRRSSPFIHGRGFTHHREGKNPRIRRIDISPPLPWLLQTHPRSESPRTQ